MGFCGDDDVWASLGLSLLPNQTVSAATAATDSTVVANKRRLIVVNRQQINKPEMTKIKMPQLIKPPRLVMQYRHQPQLRQPKLMVRRMQLINQRTKTNNNQRSNQPVRTSMMTMLIAPMIVAQPIRMMIRPQPTMITVMTLLTLTMNQLVKPIPTLIQKPIKIRPRGLV